MTFRYLDKDGAISFWTNIKNFVLSKIPTKTSELTNDSGFLTQHQSLSNYVTLNSSQTIAGIKTITGGNQGKMIFKNPNFTVGTAPEATTTVTRIYFGGGASYDSSTGVITNDITSGGYSQLEIGALNNNSSNSYRTSLLLRYEQDQTRPRFIKSWGDFCPYSDNTYYLGRSDLAWKECYCNAYYLGTTAFGDIVTHNASEFLTSHQSLANYVTTNTSQSISGIKTFPTNIDLANTSTSQREYWALKFSKTDTNGTGASQLGVFQPSNSSDFVACLRLGNPRGDNKPTAGTGVNTGNCWSGIGVYYNYALNRGYPYAPNCNSWGDSSNADAELASTAWVRRYCETTKGYLTSHQSLANYVTTNTDQTITGVKTFSDDTFIKSLNFTNEVPSPSSSSASIMPIITTITYSDSSPSVQARLNFRITADGVKSLYPHENNQYSLGLTSRRWSSFFGYFVNLGGVYLGNEASINQRTNLYLLANRDTDGQSGAYITRFRQNRAQGALQPLDLQMIGFDVLENGVRTNNVFNIVCTDWLNDVPQRVNFVSSAQSYSWGRSTNKSLFNSLEPSSLSMPDLSNGIDISSYITHLDKLVNSYTPSVNGYIFIRVKKTSLPIVSIRIQQNYGLMTSCETSDFSTWGTYLPVVAGKIVEIYVSADSLASAIFFPCQGNV